MSIKLDINISQCKYVNKFCSVSLKINLGEKNTKILSGPQFGEW